MAQDWIDQLYSDDPKERAQAVKKIAFSGIKDNLRYLIEIAENDPDPRLREYAKKAAQHLYSSQQSAQQEQKVPPISPVVSAKKTDRELTSSTLFDQAVSEEEETPRSHVKEADLKVQRAYSLHMSDRTKKALPVFAQALDLNPDLANNPYARSVASELIGKPPQEALLILQDPVRLKEFIADVYGKAKKIDQKTSPSAPVVEKDHSQEPQSPSTLIQTWLSFFGMTEDFFEKVKGQANTEDTLLSVLIYTIAAVVIFLIGGFFQFQQITTIMGEQLPQLGLNLGMIFFFILIGTVIMTPLSFYLGVGIQYLGVRLFGGSGDFKSHAYLMALIQVPMTILSGVISLLALIPLIGFVAGLGGLGLSIYTIILTVRAVKAAHNVTTGRAIAGIIVPPLVLMFIGGCLMVVFGSALGGLLDQVPNM